MKGIAHATGGTGDHLHLFMGLRATHTLSDLMREVKAESSKWIKNELALHGFAWQEGYGAFTVGAPDIEEVRRYVLDQETHHHNQTFQEEYLGILNRGLVEFDEGYLW